MDVRRDLRDCEPSPVLLSSIKNVNCIVQAETLMRSAVVDGDADMVNMLIDKKADVNKCGNNVSICIYGIL